MRIFTGIVLSGLILWSAQTSVAWAAQFAGLYEVTVPVASTDRQGRDEALSVALKRLIVRLTGNRDASNRADLVPNYQRAASYVQQSRFLEPAPGATPESTLWVRFNQSEIDTLLKRHNLPIWGSTRPQVVVWLAVDDGRSRWLVDSNNGGEWISAINAAAQQRGIPVVWPLYDVQDRNEVALIDLWGGIDEPILKASQRYRADAVLVGRIISDNRGGWQARWILLALDERAVWEEQGYLKEEVLNTGIERSADILGARFAQMQTVDARSEIYLDVYGVDELGEYAQIAQYVAELAPVKQVTPIQIQPSKTRLLVGFNGDLTVLEQLLQLGNRLQPAGRLMLSGEESMDTDGRMVVSYRMTR